MKSIPPRLVAAKLRALRQCMRAAGRGEAQRMVGRDRQLTVAAVEAGPTLKKPELLSLPDNADGDQEFRDRSTGLPLNPEMVKKARELEMQQMEELKVLEDSDRDACMTETGRPPIPGRRQKGRFAQTQLPKQAGLSRDGQQLMWKIGQRRSLRLLRTKRSICN